MEEKSKPSVLCLILTVALASLPIVSGEFETSRRLSGGAEDLDESVPFNSWNNTIETLRNGLAFVIVLVAAHPLGLLFPRFFKLPLITGYLIIGIIAGPFVANLLTDGIVNMLSTYVSALALSFISFQAGQEIYLPELRPQLKAIFILLSTLYITAMIILTTVHLLVESAFFYDDLAFNCQLGIALMFGSISVLGSPATVMAIKIELNSVGPFTSLMLGATMTAEFVVLLSFSISRIVCSIYCAELNVSMLNLMFTLSIVMSNVLVGIILAGATFAIFQIPGGEPHHHDQEHQTQAEGVEMDEGLGASAYYDQKSNMNRSSLLNLDHAPHPHTDFMDDAVSKAPSFLTPETSLRLKGLLWLSMGYVFYISTSTIAKATDAAYGLSWEVKFEPLLVLMIAACIAGHHPSIRHDMHVILDTAAPYMFLPFFVMTGAALKLDQVVHAIPLMAVYVLLRYIAIFIACYVGGRFLLKLTPRQYNNLWLTMTPQAGVALGLANEVKAMSSDTWAADFAATIVAAVVVNQIVGPVMCALGLGRAGETQKDRLAEGRTDVDKCDDKELELIGNDKEDMGRSSRLSIMAGKPSMPAQGDYKAPLPFYKLRNAIVIGDDEVAFEIALDLTLYGAHVNVPLLDQERTRKWQQINEKIIKRTAKGDLLSYKNILKDRDNAQAMSAAEVIVFTGDADRTRENIRLLTSLVGEVHSRMIVVVPDCTFSKELKAQGILVIQPSIALANIVTRMALVDQKSAEALSNEISTTNPYTTASHFLRAEGGHRASVSEMCVDHRHLALGRSVVNHHSVNYDRLIETLAAENLPVPPPPSRVAMYGTSAAEFDPFSRRDHNRSSSFVMPDDTDESDEVALLTRNSQRNRSHHRSSVSHLHRHSRSSRPSLTNLSSRRQSPFFNLQN